MHKNSSGFQNILRRIDPVLLIAAVLLVVISLTTLFSINSIYFRQQSISLLLGLIGFIFFLGIDLFVMRSMSWLIYGAIIILLILLFFFGIEVNGARSWFDIFGVRFQVSELAKPFFLLILAGFLSQKVSVRLFRFLGAIGILLPLFILIALQPDMGTAIVYGFTSFLMIMLAGFPKRYTFGSILGVIIIIPIAFQFLREYQKQRLLTFLDITNDPSGASYNAIQSLISIGSGGVIGKGFGQGTQSLLRFLPEQHTDFIFATISEDLGFVGSIAILLLFSFLLIRIYRIGRTTNDQFKYLLVMGVFSLLFVQMVFNIGMNLGLLPVIGITLPYVSYGGSSLISSFIALGIVSGVNAERQKTQSLEIG